MTIVPITEEAEASKLAKRPIVAVDLGFSGKQASTGVAVWQDGAVTAKAFRFHDAVVHVVGVLREVERAVLILEAPLSCAFDASGNPSPRGEFETKPKSRWWSVGPGAATLVSALFFLRRLQEMLSDSPVTIRLAEAFVTGSDSVADHEVARGIAHAFAETKPRWHTVAAAGEVISVLQLLNPAAPGGIPLVLEPPSSVRK